MGSGGAEELFLKIFFIVSQIIMMKAVSVYGLFRGKPEFICMFGWLWDAAISNRSCVCQRTVLCYRFLNKTLNC